MRQYRIVITRKNQTREIILNSEMRGIKIGSSRECSVKLTDIPVCEVSLINRDGRWQVTTRDSVFLGENGNCDNLVQTKTLIHGISLAIVEGKQKERLFDLYYEIDFDLVHQNFRRIIELSRISQIRIGAGSSCEVRLGDPDATGEFLTLSRDGKGWILSPQTTRYGVYINGTRISDDTHVWDSDFFYVMDYIFYYKEGRLFTSDKASLEINRLVTRLNEESASLFEYPQYNRNTRMKPMLDEEELEILEAPALPSPPGASLVFSVVPAIVTLILTIVLRGILGSGGTFVLFSICTITLGIGTSVAAYLKGKKEYQKQLDHRRTAYGAYIESKKEEMERVQKKEREILERLYYPLSKEIGFVENFTGDIFDRQSWDEDFLHVRVGTGNIPAHKKIHYKRPERLEIDDDLTLLPEEMAQKYRLIGPAPVVCDFRSANMVGILGPDHLLSKMMGNIVMDIAIRHYYRDVKMFFILGEEHVNTVKEWRYLPHLRNEEMGVRNIAYDEDSKNTLFEYIYKILASRTPEEPVLPWIVVFVLDDMDIKKHPISKYMLNASAISATFVFLENHRSLLPQGCTQVISLNSDTYDGYINPSNNTRNTQSFSYAPVDTKIAERLAIKMAPIYCEELSLESTLVKKYSMFQMFHVFGAEDIDVAYNWSKSDIVKSMAVPLGIRANQTIVELDIHEKAHGPHGLVAGTTGSGKSELLQTYILSLAAHFHPYEVGIVVIDFKGGGLVNQFKPLPHLMGAITNIDGKAVNRSLRSIKAELMKRQKLFAQYGVNQIDAYIKLYKKGMCDIPLPHLLLVVDEFAELKSEQPDFMKELISAARIGRSLGVHLILATQKPSGVINDQIWSNSKFKICLKVQSQEDSREVLKSPLAAEIKEPGRAYLQIGNNEVFELFQSAYSGGEVLDAETERQKAFTISEITLAGERKTVYQHKPEKSGDRQTTQLEAVVSRIESYCKTAKIKGLPGICLPPLGERLDYVPEKGHKSEVVLGIYDDPDHQTQPQYKLNLGISHTLIVGSAQYGKTNLLQLVIRSMADLCTPEELNIYIVDCASNILKNFDRLNHVGGVVLPSEDEKMKNLIKILQEEMVKRKEMFSDLGLSSYSAYQESGNGKIPLILLLIDNFIACKEFFGVYEDSLLKLCREGSTLGISIIMTSPQSNGIGYKYLSNFANRICLYCNDTGEYSSVFDRCRIQPDNVAGRSLVQIDKDIYECQTSLAFPGDTEVERSQSIRTYIMEKNIEYSGMAARRIPEIPRILTSEYLEHNYAVMTQEPYAVPLGLDFDSVEPVMLSLDTMPMLAILGQPERGVYMVLHHWILQMQHRIFINKTELFIFDSTKGNLKSDSEEGVVEKYSQDISDIGMHLDFLKEECEYRQSQIREYGEEVLQDMPLFLTIVYNSSFAKYLSEDKESMSSLKLLLLNGRDCKITFIFAGIENKAVAFSAPEIMKIIKEQPHCLVFEDLGNQKVFDIPLAQSRRFGKKLQTQELYYMKEDSISKIKGITVEVG